jgi:hypothetical protein
VEFVAGRPAPEAKRTSRWEMKLDKLNSIEDVVALAREYLESLRPEYLARLPADCRPVNIKYEDDLDYWAQRLSQRYCAENDEPVDAVLLHELLDFFLHALIRAAQLRRNLPGTRPIKAQ